MKDDWHWQLKKRILNYKKLSEHFNLYPSEQDYFQEEKTRDHLPLSITPYYSDLIANSLNDPLRKQVIPRIDELNIKEYELSDPLGGDKYKVGNRIIHQYVNRVLVLVTDFCPVFCRHCFRRNFSGGSKGPISEKDRIEISNYLKNHREVSEVILSGGDPLTLENQSLQDLLTSLKKARNDITLRIATRIPVVLPQRITPELIDILTQNQSIWFVTQFNHPKELTEQSIKALKMLKEGGIPILNQAVLLRGVNDSESILLDLFRNLVFHGVKPYYLFQGDLAMGTSHFRLPIKKGFELFNKVKPKLSGLEKPIFAVDLPGGGGKVEITQELFNNPTEKGYGILGKDGRTYYYPKEE
jgi:lysine 2,3-aminomutase